MPVLFRSKPGSVVMLVDPARQCSTRLLGLDPDITFGSERSIITRLTISQQVNIQFLHTLGSLVYVYVFGDRMGQVTLSGLSFACDCPSGVDLGAERMLLWYKEHRASRRRTPIRVTIGRVVIEGFVTGFTEDVVDPSVSLVQWGVTMQALPDDEGNGIRPATQAGGRDELPGNLGVTPPGSLGTGRDPIGGFTGGDAIV